MRFSFQLERKKRNNNLISLPLLKITMQLCRATIYDLALASGVSEHTIMRARAKQPVLKSTAEILAQTLKERSFQCRRGCNGKVMQMR